MTPSDLSQILSRCALRFSHFIGFNDSVSCKSVSYKNCLRVINWFPAVAENPLSILVSRFQSKIDLMIIISVKLFILSNYFIFKYKLYVLVAELTLAQVKVGGISRSQREPFEYFGKPFSHLICLDHQYLGKTIYFLELLYA